MSKFEIKLESDDAPSNRASVENALYNAADMRGIERIGYPSCRVPPPARRDSWTCRKDDGSISVDPTPHPNWREQHPEVDEELKRQGLERDKWGPYDVY